MGGGNCPVPGWRWLGTRDPAEKGRPCPALESLCATPRRLQPTTTEEVQSATPPQLQSGEKGGVGGSGQVRGCPGWRGGLGVSVCVQKPTPAPGAKALARCLGCRGCEGLRHKEAVVAGDAKP